MQITTAQLSVEPEQHVHPVILAQIANTHDMDSWGNLEIIIFSI